MGREGGCTTGLSPVADDDETTFQALSTFLRRRPSHVLMAGGDARWRRRLSAHRLETVEARHRWLCNPGTQCGVGSAGIAWPVGADDLPAREA